MEILLTVGKPYNECRESLLNECADLTLTIILFYWGK